MKCLSHNNRVSGVLPESKTTKETAKVSVANNYTTTLTDTALEFVSPKNVTIWGLKLRLLQDLILCALN
jgi:hypothetical protein